MKSCCNSRYRIKWTLCILPICLRTRMEFARTLVRLAVSNLGVTEIWCGIAEVNFGDLMKDMHELSSIHSHIVFCAKDA